MTTARELTSEGLTTIRRISVQRGFCPTTGEVCGNLARLARVRRRAIAEQAIGLGAIADTDARIGELELRPIRDTQACLGDCALAGVDIAAFVAGATALDG